jgi:cell volume regulation protein A
VLEDGRYAVCGAVLVIGARSQITSWAMRRMRDAPPEERGWLRTVIGGLAADATRDG